jgi:hypothetical protein
MLRRADFATHSAHCCKARERADSRITRSGDAAPESLTLPSRHSPAGAGVITRGRTAMELFWKWRMRSGKPRGAISRGKRLLLALAAATSLLVLPTSGLLPMSTAAHAQWQLPCASRLVQHCVSWAIAQAIGHTAMNRQRVCTRYRTYRQTVCPPRPAPQASQSGSFRQACVNGARYNYTRCSASGAAFAAQCSREYQINLSRC